MKKQIDLNDFPAEQYHHQILQAEKTIARAKAATNDKHNANVVKWGWGQVLGYTTQAKAAQDLCIHKIVISKDDLNSAVCSCGLRLNGKKLEKAEGHIDRNNQRTQIFVYEPQDNQHVAFCQVCNKSYTFQNLALQRQALFPLHYLKHHPKCATWPYQISPDTIPMAVCGTKVLEDDHTRWYPYCFICRDNIGNKYLDPQDPELRKELKNHYLFHGIEQ